MLNRTILKELHKWSDSKTRKPLLLRGARQVGKTFIVREFGKERFKNYVELNLEDTRISRSLKEELDLDSFLELVRVNFKTDLKQENTLLFIDEIQEVPWILNLFRFFYERMPSLALIASGSLLEIKIKQNKLSVPVGRIENRYIYPLSFFEHLDALSEFETLEFLNNVTWKTVIPSAIHERIINLFHRYCIIGGMPEVTQRFIEGGDEAILSGVKSDLFTTYIEDVPKYAKQGKEEHIIHIIENAPLFAGVRFSYDKFAGSKYRTDQMKEGFDALSSAMLLHQAEVTDKAEIPIIGQIKRQRKLIYLDVGLVAHKFGLTLSSPKFSELASLFRGQIAEQVVAQHLISANTREKEKLFYWAKQSTAGAAEVDFIFTRGSKLVALEVKSGVEGKLKSLLSLSTESKSAILVRLYSGPFARDSRDGKTIHSVPFYLLDRLKELLREI